MPFLANVKGYVQLWTYPLFFCLNKIYETILSFEEGLLRSEQGNMVTLSHSVNYLQVALNYSQLTNSELVSAYPNLDRVLNRIVPKDWNYFSGII